MKNLLICLMFFVLVSFSTAQGQTWNSNAGGYNGGYGQVYQSFGLAQATINMQNTTQMQIQKLMMQQAMEKKWGKEAVRKAQQQSNSENKVTSSNNQTAAPQNTAKNYAVFTPTAQTNNFKIIADTLGTTTEEKNGLKLLFVETKKGFETEAAKKGMKNNIAAAMTFLIATTVTVYHDAPEPSDEATDNLFWALNTMFDEMPEMAAVPSKDKQFLYDTYISFSGLALAGYMQAKESNDKELLKQFQIVAGSLLREVLKINPNNIRFEGNTLKFQPQQNLQPTQNQNVQNIQTPSGSHSFAKQTTNFDDGWVARPTTDYVQLQRNGTEVRLFYVNQDWDNYPNTVQHEAQYWSKAVTPYFNVSNVQKWSGVEYPVIYFVQADAVDKQTGKRYFVAMKVVFDGGGKAIVAITPNQSTYQQQFPHPNDLNKMLNYNKFGVSPQDLIGSWSGGSGGAAEYYNIYTGGYVGMSAVSTANDFVFNSNGNYQHIYRSANLNTGSSQFDKIQYNGKFSISDWEIKATNHYNGTTAKFASQIVAVKGGYLLVMTDTRNDLKYTLFRK